MTDEFAINILEQYREKPTLINEIETVEEAVWLNEALDMAIKALRQEQKTEWILVSERLPEEAGIYMTTIDYGKHRVATEERYYYGQNLGWDDDNDNCVIAWMMPLPEPYKVESED